MNHLTLLLLFLLFLLILLRNTEGLNGSLTLFDWRHPTFYKDTNKMNTVQYNTSKSSVSGFSTVPIIDSESINISPYDTDNDFSNPYDISSKILDRLDDIEEQLENKHSKNKTCHDINGNDENKFFSCDEDKNVLKYFAKCKGKCTKKNCCVKRDKIKYYIKNKNKNNECIPITLNKKKLKDITDDIFSDTDCLTQVPQVQLENNNDLPEQPPVNLPQTQNTFFETISQTFSQIGHSLLPDTKTDTETETETDTETDNDTELSQDEPNANPKAPQDVPVPQSESPETQSSFLSETCQEKITEIFPNNSETVVKILKSCKDIKHKKRKDCFDCIFKESENDMPDRAMERGLYRLRECNADIAGLCP